jgi:hypothetical protein
MFEVVKRKRHGPLESGSNILETKRNFSIGECTVGNTRTTERGGESVVHKLKQFYAF